MGSRVRNTTNNTPATQEGPRINDRIRVPEVRLIDENGVQLGVVPIREAIQRAEESGLDLVEVSPDAKPPVCKIIDYGKFKYQQDKKNHESKKKQAIVEVKEVQISVNIDQHDIITKQNHIRRWIAEKFRVRVVVTYKGREITHIDLGFKALNNLLSGVEDIAVTESNPRIEGRRLVANLLPKVEKVVVAKKETPTATPPTTSTT